MSQDCSSWILRSLAKAVALIAIGSALSLVGPGIVHADSVVGEGQASWNTFKIDAHSGPNGEDPTGTVNIGTAIGPFSGPVTKLCVSGNTAVIVGQLIEGTTYGAGFALHVQDNTKSGKADLLRLELLGYIPTECLPFSLISPTAVTSGDIVVTDDTTAPTYACNGFFAPANESIALRVDRAIPLKMELLNGTVLITDSDLAGIEPVVSVSYTSTLGPATEGTPELEAIGHSTEGNKFRYDGETGQWIFNLGTKGYAAAGTYTVTVESGNANEYILSPQCTATFVRSN